MPTTNRLGAVLKKGTPPAQQFMAALKLYTLVNHDDPSQVYFPEWAVTVRIFPDPEKRNQTVFLSSIASKYRNVGNADKCMQVLTQLADLTGVEILCYVIPSDSKTNEVKLKAWFKRHGFVGKVTEFRRESK